MHRPCLVPWGRWQAYETIAGESLLAHLGLVAHSGLCPAVVRRQGYGVSRLHRVSDTAFVDNPYRCPAVLADMPATRQALRYGSAPYCLMIQA
jgi:hypothetical protein